MHPDRRKDYNAEELALHDAGEWRQAVRMMLDRTAARRRGSDCHGFRGSMSGAARRDQGGI